MAPQDVTPHSLESDGHSSDPLGATPETLSGENRAVRTIWEAFQSGRPLIYIHSVEEQRIGKVLRKVAAMVYASPALVWTWSLTEGLRLDNEPARAGTEAPRKALDFIAAYSGPAIFHLKDFHEPLRESSEIRRRLRDAYESCLDQGRFIVITSPVALIPEEIERSVMFLELRPPDRTEFVETLLEEEQRTALSGESSIDEGTLYQLAGALLGLTLDEARCALRRARYMNGHLGPESLSILLGEKRLLVNQSGVIEYVTERPAIGEVGGLEELKKWVLERRELFRLRDSLTQEIVPKGVLIMGIPGCGKSLSVKAIAAALELPLYRIAMIEIFSGRHGKPESAFVEACKKMEDMAPAVLWFDDIEMGISSTDSGGEQGRIFAFFLTWMQEKARGLFVAATANRIDLLPAEMIRKGRFDEVFFVDLPVDSERIAIFKIHLGRRGVNVAQFDFAKLTPFTTGWAGAEIEQCVISALTIARLAGREVTTEDLVRVAVTIVPLSRTMNEQINHIREWAFERAVRASLRKQ
jgi:AAA+ superfamily predicted ATPase